MFSLKGGKNTEQTSSDCAMSLMCCKYSVLEAFYVKYLIGLSRFLLTVLSEDCNTPPILFFFFFHFWSPKLPWTYVNGGLFVSTEANIVTCSHWWLPSLNSTTILETPV